VLALYENHPCAGRVARTIQDGEALMSAINLGEVLYQLERDHGRPQAMRLVNKLRSVTVVEDPDWELVSLAARVKVPGRLSYADAFCVATAIRHGAVLFTGDPEILAIAPIVELVDLRRASGLRRSTNAAMSSPPRS
jgi:uncharacterized protein